MSASAIKRMQSLAFVDTGRRYGLELGPWVHPLDKGDRSIANPDEVLSLSSGSKITRQEYWRRVRENTRYVVEESPDAFDISDHVDELASAVRANGLALPIGPPDTRGMFEMPSTIPVVGPFSVVPGWWQLADDRALCIAEHTEEGMFIVWVVMEPHDSAGPLNHRCVSPVSAVLRVTSDGRWRFSDGEAETLPATHGMVFSDFAMCCIAMSIMQADPDVVHTQRRERAKKKARKVKKRAPGFETMRTIALPGLRYDKATGHWSAKTGSGMAWHMVRGHYRLLKSDRYVNKQGQRVWVKAHTKGDAAKPAARKRYVIGSTT